MRRTAVTAILAACLVTAWFPADANAQVHAGLVLPALTHAETLKLAAPPARTAAARADVRPRALPALYAGSVVLQGLDVQLTLKGLRLGAVEANPLMRGIVKRPAAFIAVKAAAAGLTIHAAERLWRARHRKAAIVLMAATTGVMAVVGIHNASVVRRVK